MMNTGEVTSGAFEHTPFQGVLVTKIAFGGADMRDSCVTPSGAGRLVKALWPPLGLKPNFNP
jgi:gluconolactonase